MHEISLVPREGPGDKASMRYTEFYTLLQASFLANFSLLTKNETTTFMNFTTSNSYKCCVIATKYCRWRKNTGVYFTQTLRHKPLLEQIFFLFCFVFITTLTCTLFIAVDIGIKLCGRVHMIVRVPEPVSLGTRLATDASDVASFNTG